MPVTRATTARPQPPGFREVKPAHTSKEFRAYVGRALEVLRASRSPVGRATYDYIVSGRVKIDEVGDLTRADYKRASNDLRKWTRALGADRYETLMNPKSPASKALDRLLNGYMWDDRIYVARGQSPKKLASTLVHEVNHFINKSEEHYRGPTQRLLEEYRAFYVERLYAGETMTPEKCRRLKEEVAKEYGIDRAHFERIPDVPPGLLIPPR